MHHDPFDHLALAVATSSSPVSGPELTEELIAEAMGRAEQVRC